MAVPPGVEIRVKRVYAPAAEDDGARVLVDRMWPRGVSKERARLDRWLKEIAPSDELRKWYGHDPGKWDEFQDRYASELKGHPDAIEELERLCDSGTLTLLYSSREEERNNAVALREYLLRRRGRSS